MPELSTVTPVVIHEEQVVSSRVGEMRPRQGNGSRMYANFSSAITSIRIYRRRSLQAVSAVYIGAILVMTLAILLQGTTILLASQLYVRVMMILLVSLGGGASGVCGLMMMKILLTEGMERTQEFGIRLAIGARRCDIRNQLLFEALLLSLIGGISGSACGLLIGFVLALWLQLPFVVHPMLMAFLISVSIVPGIVCGFYPALKLSHLDVERAM
jgi:ABC-type antimicrobial peptide transport system permease subunit